MMERKFRSPFSLAACLLVVSGVAIMPTALGQQKPKPPSEEVKKLNDELFRAINKRDAKAVKDSLAKGADPNAIDAGVENEHPDAFLHFALRRAVLAGDVEIVRLLLEAGAEPDLNTPLSAIRPHEDALISPYPESLEIMRLLLRAGVDPSQPPRDTMLQGKNYTDWHRRLRAGSVAENLKSRMHKAAVPHLDRGRHDPGTAAGKVRLLLDKGVDPNQPNAQGRTPLAQVVAKGAMQGRESMLNVIRELLRHGVELDGQDWAGMTALHWAVYHMDAEVVRLLLGAGAKRDLRDRFGRTPSDLAREVFPRSDVLKALGLPVPPTPTDAIRAHIAPSRVEGVAPLSVFFQGEGTDGLADNDFVNAYYDWDFDATGVDPERPRRTAIGFNVGHLFREPGEYTVRLRVRDTKGKTGEASVKIKVLPFTGRTFYVAADGDDEGPGTIERPWKSFAKSLERAEPNTRILFRRGDEFALENANIAGKEGPVLVGAYTDPRRPSEAAPLLVGSGTINMGRTTDWRFMGLHFRGPYPNVGFRTGPCAQGGCLMCKQWKKGHPDGQQLFEASGSRHVLWYRLEIEGVNGPFFSRRADSKFAVDCHLHDFGTYGFTFADNTRVAFIGNRQRHQHGHEHGVRQHHMLNSYFAHNDWTDLGVVKSTMSLRTTEDPAGRVVFARNRFDTVVAIGGNPSGGAQRHVLLDGNVSTGGFWLTAAVDSAVRNNRMLWRPERDFDPAIYRPERDGAIREQTLVALRDSIAVNENIRIYSNTYVGPQFLGGRAYNLGAFNNIIVGPSGLGASADRADGNLHYSDDAAVLEKWLSERRAAGQCVNSKTGEPQFLSLDPASPDFLRPKPRGPGAGQGAQRFDKLEQP